MLTFDILSQHVRLQPDKPVTIFEGQTISYAEMQRKAEKLGGYIRKQGLETGDIVALLLGNSDNFVLSYFACQAAGLTVLPINVRLAKREIEYILNHSEAKLLLFGAEISDLVEQMIPEIPHVQHYIHVGGSGQLRGVGMDEAVSMGEQIPARSQEPEETAVVFYTSGTTGKPKGVMLTHRNCVAVAAMWQEAMALQNDEKVQIVAPLFHCAASHVFMLPTIQAGGTLVIERGFSPQQAISTLQEENITLFFGVPAMYTLLLNLPGIDQVQAPELRMLTYGAAPMPYELIKKVKQIFPQAKVQNLYGQTENSPAATTLRDHFALDKIGSVGEPLPGCQVKVVDEEGNEQPPGKVGEIVVKGPHIMKGYLRNPEATSSAIRDGWLYSGDLGRTDEQGLLYIVDRKKDMIIRAGENVYPVEVEEVLFEIPQVLEAAVVGVPHEVYGELPKAYVVLKEGQSIASDEVLGFCRERLAKYKVPVEVEFMDALPRNASGKVLKTILRGEIKFA
jgi:long-chain acyl-CoA synthetase